MPRWPPAAPGRPCAGRYPADQEIQALKARILELQREAAMNQVEMAQLRQQVAELEARRARPAAGALACRAAPRSP